MSLGTGAAGDGERWEVDEGRFKREHSECATAWWLQPSLQVNFQNLFLNDI